VAHHIRKLLRRSVELRFELSDARDAAQAANHTKSEFIANMSHELRTPLNAIIGFSEIIQQQTFGPIENDRYRDYVDDILDSGRHLLGIVTEILDLSKIEAGKMDLHEQECDMAALVDGCITFLRQKADEAGVMVVNDLPVTTPSIVGDERALKQIVINLLSNAIKFTPVGGEIRISLSESASGGMTLMVQDNGIGIAAEDIKKVMDPFGQVENAYTRQHEGTGLGLPLVKAMAEMHHGSFRLESEIDLGTKAIVEFPEDRIIGAFKIEGAAHTKHKIERPPVTPHLVATAH
jgi:signal transduction histidine kinase